MSTLPTLLGAKKAIFDILKFLNLPADPNREDLFITLIGEHLKQSNNQSRRAVAALAANALVSLRLAEFQLRTAREDIEASDLEAGMDNAFRVGLFVEALEHQVRNYSRTRRGAARANDSKRLRTTLTDTIIAGMSTAIRSRSKTARARDVLIFFKKQYPNVTPLELNTIRRRISK